MSREKKVKQRIHREWFRPVSLGNRKSCPSCGEKLALGESIWSWGEYVRAKWRTVQHFCKECYPGIRSELTQHAGRCGCQFELVGYGCSLPEWLTLEPGKEVCDVTSPQQIGEGLQDYWGSGDTGYSSEDGTVDLMAYDYGSHNGPRCARCGYSFCMHCHGVETECSEQITARPAPAGTNEKERCSERY